MQTFHLYENIQYIQDTFYYPAGQWFPEPLIHVPISRLDFVIILYHNDSFRMQKICPSSDPAFEAPT